MIEVTIPGREPLVLTHALFDLNGTLALDGRVADAVADALGRLRTHVDCAVLSADTHGTLAAVAASLGVRAVRVASGAEKAAHVAALRHAAAEPVAVAAVGNGRNDVPMFRAADLAIAVLGGEGLAADALSAADLVAASGIDAIGLLLHPTRLTATLRP